jgi:hypothetical protein
MQIEISFASESHVPRFRAGVGTWRSGYMIPIRLPWRHRARPSATLHEIQFAPKGKLISTILHTGRRFVKSEASEYLLHLLRNLDCHTP